MEITYNLERMLYRLRNIRADMTPHKSAKIRGKWDEKGDYRAYGIGGVINSLLDEMKELKQALNSKGPDEIKGEVVDVSNMLDMLWDCLTYRGS